MGKLRLRAVPATLLIAGVVCLVAGPCLQAALAGSPASVAFPSGSQQRASVPAVVARFDRLSTADGLPDDRVFAILQDRQGFMWFGTGNGLARYDGHDWTVYQNDPSDPATLSHDTVFALAQTRNGDLWVGTGSGLDRFEPATGTFHHFPMGRMVLALYEDSGGLLWVGTSAGLTHLDPADPQPSAFCIGMPSDDPRRLSGTLVRSIIQDRVGAIWLGTGAGELLTSTGLDRLDPATETFVHYRHDPGDSASLGAGNVWALVQDREGVLWVGTQGGLNRLELDSQTFARYQHDPGDPLSLANDEVTALLEDGKGRLWAGTADGLDLLDRGQQQFTHYRHDDADAKSLSAGEILTLYEDRSGVVWIGTRGGISRLDETASQFALYSSRPSSPYRLSDDAVLALCEDRSGMLWVGTAEGGLNRVDREAGAVTVFRHDPADPASLSSDAVSALYEDRAGDLWVGTGSRWLERFDPQTETFVHTWYLSAGAPTIIVGDRSGDLWLGTSNGLYRLDLAAKTATHYRSTGEPALSNNLVTAILELRDGRLVVGTNGGGVSIWNPATETFDHWTHDPSDPNSPAHGSVFSFYEEPGGSVGWIGTWRGLDRVDYGGGAVSHYSARDGLSGNAVLGILADPAGVLWLTTNRGLSRFDPNARTFRSYGAQDGLPAGSFVLGATAQGRDGEILIGTTAGLLTFRPQQLPENPHPPPVAVTSLSLFNEVIIRDPPVDEPIVLSYRQNFLSFEFAALDYTSPEKNLYAYRLEGVDSSWVQAGTRRRADYPNLSPGSYLFRVRGSNNAGVWNEEGAAVRITITPPAWGTWWFRGAVLLLLLGAVLGAYRLRTRSIQSRSRQLERQVAERTAELSRANIALQQEMAERTQVEQALRDSEKEKAAVDERNRLARELHDSVAQSMYGVTLLAEVASQLLAAGRTDQAGAHLAELKSTALESLAEMRLLIYELRPPVLEEEGLAAALQARLESVESRAGLATEFHLIGERILEPRAEQALFGIAQEALNNILKHAQARHVSVSLRQAQRSATLEIADDGIGFDPVTARRGGGLGLRGMEERAAELGGRLEISSAAGSGTRLRVEWERGPE